MGRNSNLTVPQGLSNQDRRFAEGIKENLDVILGHRGDPLQRAVTFQDLLDANIIEFARGINLFSSTSDIVPVVNDIPNLDIPPAPTSLQASGAFQNIVLTWNLSLYKGHSFVEVFRHTSDSISSATMVAQVSGFTGVYSDAVGEGQTFYYWVRAVNGNGVLGPFNSSTGTQGQTAPDIDFLLTTLANSITSSQLASSLSDPIGNLPANTANSITSVETAQNTQGVTIASQATSITNLNTTVGGHTTSISTQASSINGLSAQYTVKIDNNGAVAGYGLASTTTGAGNIVSEFIVNADRFAIMRGGSNTAAATVPFVVQSSSTTLNGETVDAGVYMADAFIKNGSIQSAKIGTLAVDKLTGTMSEFETQIAGTISTSRLNIDGATLTADPNTGALQVNQLNANVITSGTIIATVMQGTDVYANRLTGDVNKLLPFRSTTSVPFKGNAASGGGTVVVTTQTLPATTHLTTGHKPFASVTGWYDSTNGKTYSFKLYMQLGTGSYTLVGETRFKANTNLYAQFAVSGSLSTATTLTVNLKLEVTRTGSSGIFDSDTSTTVDNIYEVSGFILGAR